MLPSTPYGSVMSQPPRNLLADETSPYLRQHAANPVHWRAWHPGSLAEAAELQKPILLSVGYAACHWCHVMAHESFEDPEVAEVMNRLFVNIKVDREERPDIDQIYMAALTALGEQGGWPLTIFLTPETKPFWGGTYFPKEPRYGRPGFVQVLEAVAAAWRSDTDRIAQSADALTTHVSSRLAVTSPPQDVDPNALPNFANAISSMMDARNGGLRGAPKFPNAPFLHTLWLNWLLNGERRDRDHVIRTLEVMLAGGIYDHVGGGMARYSTDADWIVPHFEKMLYDNAQLIRLCNWAYAETGQELFRIRIEETIDWLRREMVVAGGGFASSLDADSEGEEGLYYTWTETELYETPGAKADIVANYFTLARPPAWEGKPILTQSLEQARGCTANDVRLEVGELKQRLRAKRAERVPPGRDDKVLVDWNGLAIAAIAEAGRTLGRPEWIKLAASAYAFILGNLNTDDRPPHSMLGAAALFPSLSSDLAALSNAAISLFEATGDRAFLDNARGFLAQLSRWHQDDAGDGHYLTAADARDVPIRIRGDVDEAIPSATGQVIEALARFAMVSGDGAFLETAWSTARHAAGRVRSQSFGQAGIHNGAAVLLNLRKLIVVEDPSSPNLRAVANRLPDPRRVDLFIPMGSAGSETLPGGTVLDRSRPAAYLCEGASCRPAIDDPDELARHLSRRDP